MAVISRVLFDGSYDNYGYIYQLEDEKIVFYFGDNYFESGYELHDYHLPFARNQFGDVSLEDIVAQQWDERGPRFYFLKNDSFFSQEFIERNDMLEPIGTFKSERFDLLYDLEEQYYQDFDGDGYSGKPPARIEQVLFDGSSYGYDAHELPSLYKLQNGDYAFLDGSSYYNDGDEIQGEHYSLLTESALSTIDLQNIAALDWNGSPVFYYWSNGNILRQDFSSRDGQFEPIGQPEIQSRDQLRDLEDVYDHDIDGDGDAGGVPLSPIENILIDSYGGLYQLEDGRYVYSSDSFYSNGDYIDRHFDFQVIADADLGDVALSDAIATDHMGSNGPKFFFWNGVGLYSQQYYYSRHDLLDTTGDLRKESIERLYEFEKNYSKDINGDTEIGKPPVYIERVLIDGSYGNGGLYELEDGQYVYSSNGNYYVSGDSFDEYDYYQVIEESDFGDVTLSDAIASDWGNGPRFYLWDGEELYSQEFRDRNGQLETRGKLQGESVDRLYEFENNYDEDFDGDGEIGKPPVYIERVLIDGSYGNGGLYELEDGQYVYSSNGNYYVSGDRFDEYDYYQVIEESDFGDVTLSDAIASDWGNGPRFYLWDGEELYSQEFRDRNGQLETRGKLQGESVDRLYEFENNYDEDFDGDGEIGKPPVYIERVLIDGSYGNGGLYELEGGQYVYSNSTYSYGSGDSFDEYDYYQVIEESDFGDVTLSDAIASDWGNGPRFYLWDGEELYSQEFRDRNGQLETRGKLQGESIGRLYELENNYDEDFDGDGEIGKPPVYIERVLIDGSYGNGGLYELEDGQYVYSSNGNYYVSGDSFDEYDYYQVIEESDFGDVTLSDAIASDWGNGPRFYLWDGEELYSQEFRDRNGQLETRGKLQGESVDRLYEFENNYDEDFDGDGEIGKPPVYIERVLIDGSYGNGGLYELEGGQYVYSNSTYSYGSGDSFDEYDYYQVIEESDFGDVTLSDAIASDWGNGPRFYLWDGEELYSQEFRDRNGQLETRGKLQGESIGRLYELENNYDEDFDGDGEIGKPPVYIERVLIDGSYGNGGLYELEDGQYVYSNSTYSYGSGDSFDEYDYYQVIEESDFGDVTLSDAIASDWGNGPRFYLWDGEELYSQEFRDRNGQLETRGKLQGESIDRLYEFENNYGEDFDGDGEVGRPDAVVESVVFTDGLLTGNGSLYRLSNGDYAFSQEGGYESGDVLPQFIGFGESDFGDFTLGDAIAMEWGNRGPRIYFLDRGGLYSQDFRDRNGDLQADSKLKNASQETLYELEDLNGEDYDGDGEVGEPTQFVESVLFSGSEGDWGWGLYELDDSSMVVADAELSEGDTPSDSRQLVTTKGDDFSVDGEVLGGYSINRGFAVLYEDGARIMRQNFRETGDVARTNGKPKSLSAKQVAALEDDHGVDYNRDGIYGSESSVIASVLFDGEEGSWGWGLYELDDSSMVVADAELSEGDTPSDSRQLVTTKGDDFSVDGEVLGGYGINRGFAVLYEDGARIMRQNFRETGDVARTNGKPKILSAKQVAALEDDHGVDYNRDGVYGTELSVIASVLYAGEEGSWGRGLYELDDASVVVDDAELSEGDTPSDSRQLVTTKGDDFSVDGGVLGGYRINRGFAVLYEDGARIMRQNFRETGDVARTNGKPKSLSAKQVAALEDDHGVDYNRDGVYGTESSVIASVLFDGEEGNWGWGLYELDDSSMVVADAELGEGDTPSDSRQLVTNKGDDFSVDGEVLGGYGINRGFAVLYEDGARIMRQNFRETGDVARTNGKPKSLSAKQVAALEDDHGVDYNRDGIYGSESSVIASVLFDGEEGSWGWGLYELDDSSMVVADAELGEGDTPSDSRQLVTTKGDDFSVDGEVLGGYGINRGFAVLYEDGARIMRQNFRETGDVARTNGKPKSLSAKQVAALEDDHGVDYNRDGVYGSESSVIASVLFDGEEGSWGWGLYELDDSSMVVADAELSEGDTPSDSRQLVTTKGDDFSVDGEVLGGYGINRGFAVLYEDGARIMRQNFRETGDVARTNGKPKNLSDKTITDLEDQHGVDFNRDSLIGAALPVIDQVLFDGLQGDWKQGIYAVDGGALMIGEQDLNPGDELVDGARLLASSGDLAYSVDGQVVGAYGSGRTASLVYEDNSAYFSQRFRLSGSDAVASGAPAEVTGRIYAMEDQHDIDFTGDGVFGEVLA